VLDERRGELGTLGDVVDGAADQLAEQSHLLVLGLVTEQQLFRAHGETLEARMAGTRPAGTR
jgi:hypothetical protein